MVKKRKKIVFKFHSILQTLLKMESFELDEEKISLEGAVQRVDKAKNTDIAQRLFSGEENISTGVVVLINGKSIGRFNGEKTILASGDIIDILPPGTGG